MHTRNRRRQYWAVNEDGEELHFRARRSQLRNYDLNIRPRGRRPVRLTGGKFGLAKIIAYWDPAI